MFDIVWNRYAEITFSDEVEFILSKWNIKEVENFFELVEKSVKTISLNPFIGREIYNNNYALVISRQTTIYYKVFEEQQYIELLVFWPNLRNPDHLLKYL